MQFWTKDLLFMWSAKQVLVSKSKSIRELRTEIDQVAREVYPEFRLVVYSFLLFCKLMVLYDILGFSLHAWTLIDTERGRSWSGISIRSVLFSILPQLQVISKSDWLIYRGK